MHTDPPTDAPEPPAPGTSAAEASADVRRETGPADPQDAGLGNGNANGNGTQGTWQRRLALLAEVTARMTEPVDVAEAMRSFANALVPELADVVVVQLVAPDGALSMVEVAHIDADAGARLRASVFKGQHDLTGSGPVANAMRTRRTQHFLDPESARAATFAVASDHAGDDAQSDLDMHASVLVPLVARGRLLGVVGASTLGTRPLSPLDAVLFEEVSRRAAATLDLLDRLAEEQRLTAQLQASESRYYELATTLQRSLMPARLPELEGCEVAAHYLPAATGTEVGGDFYDVFAHGRDWLVVIGDVCGKGAAAAAVTALVRYTVRAIATYERRPAAVLRQVNDAMCAQTIGDQFCTAALARLTPSYPGWRLTVANAGHPPVLVLRAAGTVDQVGGHGPLLGIYPHARSFDETTELRRGDTVFFYTDGVIEARSPHGDRPFFGEERLAAVLREHEGRSAEEVADGVLREVRELQQAATGRDDLAVIALRVLP